MKAQDQAEPRTNLDPSSVRIDCLRYDVEKQIRELSPTERDQVIQILSQPIAKRRLTSVKRLKEFGVFEIDVTGSVRMYFRKMAEMNCIIFVGRHGNADIFMDRYSGNMTERLVPLGESEIMTKKRSGSPHANGQVSPLADKTPPANSLPCASPVLDWAAPLQRALFERVDQAAADQVEHLQEEMADKIEHLKEEMSALVQLLHETESRFKTHQQVVATDLKTHEDKVHGDVSATQDAQEAMERTHRADLDKLNQRVEHTSAQLGECIEQMAATLIRERVAPLAQRLEEMTAEQVRFVAQTAQQEANRAQEAARMAQTLQCLEVSVEELRTQVTSEQTARLLLEETVDRVRADLEAWREEQARKASQTLWARLVRFFRRKR